MTVFKGGSRCLAITRNGKERQCLNRAIEGMDVCGVHKNWPYLINAAVQKPNMNVAAPQFWSTVLKGTSLSQYQYAKRYDDWADVKYLVMLLLADIQGIIEDAGGEVKKVGWRPGQRMLQDINTCIRAIIDQRKVTETERHNRSMEEINRNAVKAEYETLLGDLEEAVSKVFGDYMKEGRKIGPEDAKMALDSVRRILRDEE